MPAQATHDPNPQREACTGVLDALLVDQPAVIMASLSMVDGRAFAAACRNGADPRRVAALSSSLLALSESFARELQCGRCNHTTISTEYGCIVTVRVPTSPQLFALSLCVDNAANLAMALRWTLDAATRLAAALQRPA